MMSLDSKESARSPKETGTKTAATPTTRKSSRPPQTDRVRRMLSAGWTCGIAFLNPSDGGPPILRYTARIHELRRDGWLIDRRPCQHPWHDHGPGVTMFEWRLAGRAEPGSLFFQGGEGAGRE